MFEEIFLKRYNNLNQDQKKAVDSVEGPVMVVAGPGSGKTELLSLRVANILRTQDIGPENILCLTFTDSGSVAMRKRLSSIIGSDAYKVGIFTFHSFGTWVIKTYFEHFFSGSHFEPADDIEQLVVMNELFESLPQSNPLATIDYQGGFVYLEDALKRISSLKRAGISPSDYKQILIHNHECTQALRDSIDSAFKERVSLKSIKHYDELYEKIKTYSEHNPLPSNLYYNGIAETIAHSLAHALKEVAETGKSTPLSHWKAEYLEKEEDGEMYVLKSEKQYQKSIALADIYDAYRTEMKKRGRFDYDDMLVDVINTIKTNSSLRVILAERFQYVLIDEYQDTNDAQFKLILSIVLHDDNDKRPNIMAVGDDDQAIYRFQGADISNILDFKHIFQHPEIIVLKKNYRSTFPIVSFSRSIMLQAEDRLETRFPDLVKDLESIRGKGVDITYRTLPSKAHEYTWIAYDIAQKIKDGIEPSNIAILGRSHSELEACTAHLHHHNIPLRYERQLNVLSQVHVSQIITILRYVGSLSHPDPAHRPQDELLPEILAYPFWKLKRTDIWELSQYAYAHKSTWIDALQKSKNNNLNTIAQFFLELSIIARREPAEIVLDYIIGSERPLFVGTDDPDEPIHEIKPLFGNYSSPFREYYFGNDVYESKKSEYISFLSSLRVFITALRDHKKGEKMNIHDALTFVDLHTKHNKLVADTSPFVSAPSAVSIMTSHKAKGLEWDIVYIIGCTDEQWTSRGRGTKLAFPPNIPISPAGDSKDDFIRIFYVAVTRARDELILTSHTHNNKGAPVEPLRFLVDSQVIPQAPSIIPEAIDVLQASLDTYHISPLSTDEESILNEILSTYIMSVTHLNNFLNVTRGGPRTFLEHNLLRFPQTKTPSSALGTTLHACIEYLHRELRSSGFLPSHEMLIEYFNERLYKERLSHIDIIRYGERGRNALLMYVEHKKDTFKPDDIIERSFIHDGICVGDVPISGVIDKISFDNSFVSVTDFKTGKAPRSWKATTDSEAIKLYNYKRQLSFYKILIENSHQFKGKTMNLGTLEFLEPLHSNTFISLESVVDEKEVERTKALIEKVYYHITHLNFIDTQHYEPTLKGIIAFEDDLLSDKV